MKYTCYTKRAHCNVRIELYGTYWSKIQSNLLMILVQSCMPDQSLTSSAHCEDQTAPPTNLSKLSFSGSRGLVVESGSTVFFCSCMTSLLLTEAVVLLPPLGSGLASCDSRC